MVEVNKELLSKVERELWIKPEALFEFLYYLRDHDYNIGVEQFIATESLLAGLATRKQFPRTLEELCSWVGPIICTKPEEQSEFQEHLRDWLKERKEIVVPPTPPRPVAQKVQRKIPEELKRRRFPLHAVAGAVLIGIVVLSALLFHKYGPNSNQNQQPSTSPSAPQTPSASSSESPLQSPAPAETPGRDTTVGFATKALTKSGAVIIETEPTSPRLRFLTDHFLQICIAVASLPVLLLLFRLLWNTYHRRRQLEKWRSDKRPRLHQIAVKGIRERIFKDPAFRRAARELRRHRRFSSTYLDEADTVKATASRAGLFTPVYAMRRALPEYLMLIDRASFSDQLASLTDELIDRLRENDIDIDRYYFNRDPRTCYRQATDSAQLTVEDLAGRHPEHYLIIFTDGSGLINPLTGQPQLWLELFTQWRGRAILTPEPVLDWGYREWALSHDGFVVLPSGKAGLNALADFINTGALSKTVATSARPYPEILRKDTELWMQPSKPSPRTLRRLSAQLRRYLGDAGYHWLAACAVYPALQWDLTLYLGYELIGPSAMEEHLWNLVRLPWFRQGTMPDWLRSRLISDMKVERERRVREKLEELLANYIENPVEGFQLSVVPEQAPKRQGWLRALATKISERIRKWSQRRLLRYFIKVAPPGSLLQDRVFLNFLSGRRLAVTLPERLRRALFRRGRIYLGLRPGNTFAGAAIVAAMLFVVSERALPTGTISSIPVPGPTPYATPAYTFTPTFGVQGKSSHLTVASIDCEQDSLDGLTLRLAEDSGIVVQQVKADECQLSADLSIDAQAKAGDVQMELVNGDTILATFPYRVVSADALCPTITIDCPSQIAADAKTIKLTATVTGADPSVKPSYNWQVTQGTIVSGQGTQTITVSFNTPAAELYNEYEMPQQQRSQFKGVGFAAHGSVITAVNVPPQRRRRSTNQNSQQISGDNSNQGGNSNKANQGRLPTATMNIPMPPVQQTSTQSSTSRANSNRTNRNARPVYQGQNVIAQGQAAPSNRNSNTAYGRQPGASSQQVFNFIATVTVEGIQDVCVNSISCTSEMTITDNTSKVTPPPCTLPFASIAQEHDIDRQCPPEGSSSRESDRAQNRIKNNLCAAGQPVPVTFSIFDQLQSAVDRMVASGMLTYGSGGPPQPEDRPKLQDIIKVNGTSIGEGTIVTLEGFVFDAKHDDSFPFHFQGESVNCKNSALDWNDIHIALVSSPTGNECSSVTAEIVPHRRPASWDRFDSNPVTSPYINNPLPVKGQRVRITGQLFFDGSHVPNTCNNPSSGGNPLRRATWEIHPVYAIDIYDTGSGRWIPLDQWARNR